MAGLKGYNGKIVIDEHEAKEDVKKIDDARSKIATAREMLNPSKIDGSRMAGATRNGLSLELEKICRALKELEDACGGTSNFINQTVAKYQRIDRELRDQIRGGR